jgi:hypothetical protein
VIQGLLPGCLCRPLLVLHLFMLSDPVDDMTCVAFLKVFLRIPCLLGAWGKVGRRFVRSKGMYLVHTRVHVMSWPISDALWRFLLTRVHSGRGPVWHEVRAISLWLASELVPSNRSDHCWA